MLAIDTNIVVRVLLGDDPEQAAMARDLVANNPVKLSSTVLIETAWVLRRTAGYGRSDIVRSLRLLAGLPTVFFEEEERLIRTLDWIEAGMDVADAFHLAEAYDCEAFISFDRKLAKIAGRCEAMEVRGP